MIVGQILARQGSGRLISIDHDAQWAAETKRYVQALGLETVVEVVHAPLEALELNGRHFRWYSIDRVFLSNIGVIDLLVVDGPPRRSSNGEMARYPAFPVRYSKLSTRAIVFVDDVGRADKKAMIKNWLISATEWNARYFHTVDGVAILSRADLEIS